MSKFEGLPLIVAVDFDGTLCKDSYPYIGEPKQDMIDLVKAYQKGGWKTILWTCRTDEYLEAAVKWCREHGLEFDAVNTNIDEVKAMFGGDTRKVFADRYIDDKNEFVEKCNGC